MGYAEVLSRGRSGGRVLGAEVVEEGYEVVGGAIAAWCGVLLDANRLAIAARQAGRDALTEDELDAVYAAALARARQDNRNLTTTLATHARTLSRRFEEHREVILRFTTDLTVPFTNNQAERDIRPAKIQQRSSGGCWRTLQGLADFAIVQSYLSTAGKRSIRRYDALKQLFTTGAWIPHTLTPDTTAA